jgi:hypothetical protein
MVLLNDDLLHLRKLSFGEISISMFGITQWHRLVQKIASCLPDQRVVYIYLYFISLRSS